MARALSASDQRPTSRGGPINELVANICQVVAPTPPSLNDRFQFLLNCENVSRRTVAELNSHSDGLSPNFRRWRGSD